MDILPARPLRLDPAHLARLARKTWLMTALFVAVGAGFSTACYFWTAQVLDELALWKRGVAGEIHDISGSVRAKGKFGIALFHLYELDVEYVDQSGDLHRGKAEFDLFLSRFEGELSDISLRYDPAAPERFVLSCQAEAGWPHWGLPALMGALGLLMWIAIPSTWRAHRNRSRWLELVALDGEELLAPLRGVSQEQGGGYRVKFSCPESGAKLEQVLTKEPLVVEVEKVPHVVVLRSPREAKSHIVIQSDLAPFAFDAATRSAILERAGGD
jgi:hypothetical protein